jgi:hypothetical protein
MSRDTGICAASRGEAVHGYPDQSFFCRKLKKLLVDTIHYSYYFSAGGARRNGRIGCLPRNLSGERTVFTALLRIGDCSEPDPHTGLGGNLSFGIFLSIRQITVLPIKPVSIQKNGQGSL